MQLRAGLFLVRQVPRAQVRHGHGGPFWAQNNFEHFREVTLDGMKAASKSGDFWYKACLFGVIPACILATWNGYRGHQAEHEMPRPEFIPYAHLQRRIREYPWGGMRSLFHNPHTNALPDGYETEDHHH